MGKRGKRPGNGIRCYGTHRPTAGHPARGDRHRGLQAADRPIADRPPGPFCRFVSEARDVLRAGLATTTWVTFDDTGARHKGASAFCTQIGNNRFASFGTTASKSRRASHGDYVINAQALAYMRDRSLAGVIRLLDEHNDKQCADRAAW